LLSLSFSTEFVQFLVDHRTATTLLMAKLFSMLGEVEGYVLIIALIYTCFDKGLAYRLAIIALLAMTLNHFLKTLIGNPRPFVADGSYPGKWAVSPENLRELASESSTPSGHAMSAGAFYAYLVGSTRNTPLKVVAVFAIVLTGLSRPVLGVHYLEDVLLGWAIGIAFALIALRYQTRISAIWARQGGGAQTAFAAAASLTIYFGTLSFNHGDAARQPLLFVEYLGFLTGVVAARPLELRLFDFDPLSGSLVQKCGRWLITVALIMVPLLAHDSLIDPLVSDRSVGGHFLKYLAYLLAGFSGLLIAPAILAKVGLAEYRSRNN
jgi:membrane-associated phospholipid phosphatase